MMSLQNQDKQTDLDEARKRTEVILDAIKSFNLKEDYPKMLDKYSTVVTSVDKLCKYLDNNKNQHLLRTTVVFPKEPAENLSREEFERAPILLSTFTPDLMAKNQEDLALIRNMENELYPPSKNLSLQQKKEKFTNQIKNYNNRVEKIRQSILRDQSSLDSTV